MSEKDKNPRRPFLRTELRMMRKVNVLRISLLILILFSFPIFPCKATIEKDFGENVYRSWGIEWFSFTPKIVIETEKDGTWRTNTTYRIYIAISLTYINNSFVSYIRFNETMITTNVDIEYKSTPYGYLYEVGDIVEVNYWVKSPNVATRIDLKPAFSCWYHDIYGETPRDTWLTQEPLYVDVTATDISTQIDSLENQLNTIRNLMYVITIATIFLCVTTIYFMRKSLKKSYS